MADDASLPLRAENNPKFYGRFKWLGLGMLGFMVYCIYDATTAYPAQQARGKALLALAEEHMPADKLEELHQGNHGAPDFYLKVKKRMADFPEFQAAWDAKAEQEGWPSEPYKKLRTDGDILGNYLMAVLSGLAGVWFLLTVFRTNGRWFELNAEGVTSRWGESFALSQVTAIDKKQWRDKGIARVRYTDPKGGKRTFVVDDYKYDKLTTDRILWRIEQEVGEDKIVGGKPGPDPDAKSADASPASTEAISEEPAEA